VAIIPKPPFPNVPKLPGVPQLARSNLFPAAPPAIINLGLGLGALGVRLWEAFFAQPQWAIYKALPPDTKDAEGITTVTSVGRRVPVVVPDSFGEFGYRNEPTVSDFPIQDGAFANYNKVANPYEVVVRLYKGGTKQARKEFLDSIVAIVDTLDLYDIITPEQTYLNVNVVRYELSRRGARGAYFLSEVDLFFRQIRQVTATYTNTGAATQNAQNPSAEPVINTGTVQAQATEIQ
jgi:hypothetical protein